VQSATAQDDRGQVPCRPQYAEMAAWPGWCTRLEARTGNAATTVAAHVSMQMQWLHNMIPTHGETSWSRLSTVVVLTDWKYVHVGVVQ
jgi:hypothetical protein